jgi:hypothetical protein
MYICMYNVEVVLVAAGTIFSHIFRYVICLPPPPPPPAPAPAPAPPKSAATFSSGFCAFGRLITRLKRLFFNRRR